MKTVSYVTKISDYLRVANKNRKHKITRQTYLNPPKIDTHNMMDVSNQIKIFWGYCYLPSVYTAQVGAFKDPN